MYGHVERDGLTGTDLLRAIAYDDEFSAYLMHELEGKRAGEKDLLGSWRAQN